MTWNPDTKLCWSKNTVEEIAKFDAVTVSNGVFQATHHPLPLTRRVATQSPGQGVLSSEQSLVDEFYKDSNIAGLILVAITGPSGIGKSHLVRLLNVKRPKNDKLHIVYIPKADTNLRGSIQRILMDLGSEFDLVRDLLKTANNNESSLELNSQKFLDAVAHLMKEDLETKKSFYSLEERFFLEHIPNLIQDPEYKSKLIELGGPQRICSRPQGIPSDSEDENSTQLVVADFLFSDIDLLTLSASTRMIYTQMSGKEDLQKLLVDFLNEHFVERAISDVYWNKGPKLTTVMSELRAILFTQGKELVLLIEDLVSFSGTRGELLDAIKEEDTTDLDGTKTKSPLRVAFGITDGEFRIIFDTISTRLLAIYELNLPIANHAETPDTTTRTFTSDDQLLFISRYLNASRLSINELDDLEKNSASTVPNPCDFCEVRENCHNAFGEIGGVGLYPFNKSAITKLTRGLNPNRFTPRFIVRDFISHILLEFEPEIAAKKFPSNQMVERFENFEKINIPNEELLKLKHSLGHESDFERLVNLQKFWSNDYKELQTWPKWMQECFKLPELKNGVLPVPIEPIIPSKTEPPSVKPRFDLTQFDKWSNKSASLPADMASIIRTSLYQVVASELENRFGINANKPYFSLTDGKFLRRNSFRIKDAEGGGLDGDFSFATFEIEKTLENAVVMQRIISQSERGLNIDPWTDIDKYLEFISWIDPIVNSFHNKFLQLYPDCNLEIQFLLIGNALLGNSNSSDTESIKKLLQDSSLLPFDNLTAGRTREWISEIEAYKEERTNFLAEIKTMLGTQKGIGGTLSTRLASRLAQVKSTVKPFGDVAISKGKYVTTDKIILQKKILTLQKNITSLVKIEQAQNIETIEVLTRELDGGSIDELIRDIRAIVDTIVRSFPGQIISQAQLNEFKNLLTDLDLMKSIDLTEPNQELTDVEAILTALSNTSYATLIKFKQDLSQINQRLSQILLTVEAIADASGAPTKLAEGIEDQFEKLGNLIQEIL